MTASTGVAGYIRDQTRPGLTAIGGFVRLEGEEGESDDPRSFVRQRLPTRLAILLAGVAMNAVLAFVLLTLIAAFADPSSTVRVLSVQDGSPAQQMGLRGGQQVGGSRPVLTGASRGGQNFGMAFCGPTPNWLMGVPSGANLAGAVLRACSGFSLPWRAAGSAPALAPRPAESASVRGFVRRTVWTSDRTNGCLESGNCPVDVP